MTTEDQLSAMLHELTPEPPRPVTVADVAMRVQSTATATARPARRRVALAVVAACATVIAVVVAVVVARGGGGTQHAPIGTTHTSVPAPTTSPAPARTTASATPPFGTIPNNELGPELAGTVDLGGARLTLPAGVFARRITAASPPAWCLTTAPHLNGPVNIPIDCTTRFIAVGTAPQKFFGVDSPGGDGSALQCSTAETRTNYTFGFRTFGGRLADYRAWQDRCDGHSLTVSQYAVDTAPGFILFAAGSLESTLVTQVVPTVQLPPQTAPLRLETLGNVDARSHQSDGWHVTVRPYTRQLDGQFVPVPGGTATTYVIPDRFVPDNGISLVGTIDVRTDGHQVTALSIVGG